MSNLIKKIVQTGSIDRKRGNDRRRSVPTSGNTKYVEQRILCQETNPGSHPTPANISKRLDISQNSAWRIAKDDLNHLNRSKVKSREFLK